MKSDGCEGCNIYIPNQKRCLLDKLTVDRVERCPCRECLVKMMCSRGCKEWREISHLRLGGQSETK